MENLPCFLLNSGNFWSERLRCGFSRGKILSEITNYINRRMSLLWKLKRTHWDFSEKQAWCVSVRGSAGSSGAEPEPAAAQRTRVGPDFAISHCAANRRDFVHLLCVFYSVVSIQWKNKNYEEDCTVRATPHVGRTEPGRHSSLGPENDKASVCWLHCQLDPRLFMYNDYIWRILDKINVFRIFRGK